MQYTSLDNEVTDAIIILDRLININASNTMESIRRFKNNQELDMFSSFRLKKELARVNKQL